MVKLNILMLLFDLDWTQLFELWLKNYCIHYKLPEYESLVVAYFGYKSPSVPNGGSALTSRWFLKPQSLCILAMKLKSQSSLFQKWSFLLFSCGMDHIIYIYPFGTGSLVLFMFIEITETICEKAFKTAFKSNAAKILKHERAEKFHF